MLDPMTNLRESLDEYRRIIRELRAELNLARAEAVELRAAIGAIERANGYGLDVPEDYDDDHGWLVDARAIRACRRAVGENL